MPHAQLNLAALALLAGLSWAAAPGYTEVESDPWLDANKLKAIAVLPFSDPLGHGRVLAEKVNSRLEALAIRSVDLDELEPLFKELGQEERSDALGITALNELRQRTSANALLVVDLRCGRWRKHKLWQGISIVLLDTMSGDVLVEAKLEAPRSGYRDANAIADEVIKALSGPLGKGGAKKTRKPGSEKDLPAFNPDF
ncbi:MAG: hypothetical protein WC881_09595 [Elusimicrobiota bacterium]|jgi:hypothetical protein